MKLTGPDKGELMTVSALERDGQDLLIKGKVFGTMPMTARLTPDQARAALRLVDWRMAVFLVTLPWRRGS